MLTIQVLRKILRVHKVQSPTSGSRKGLESNNSGSDLKTVGFEDVPCMRCLESRVYLYIYI